jgi:hypothetical protein
MGSIVVVAAGGVGSTALAAAEIIMLADKTLKIFKNFTTTCSQPAEDKIIAAPRCGRQATFQVAAGAYRRQISWL